MTNLNYRVNYLAEEFADISLITSHEIGFTAMDIFENSEMIYVEVELSGVLPKDITVTVTDDRMVIEGVKYEPVTRQPGLIFTCAERNFGSFRRVFALGSAVESENIEASYKNGILKLKIPKRKERRKPSHPIKVRVDE